MIRAERRWVLKMVEPDFSFNSAENMVKLLCLMDKDSKDPNDMQDQPAGVQNMLQRCSAADRHFFILPGTFIFGLILWSNFMPF